MITQVTGSTSQRVERMLNHYIKTKVLKYPEELDNDPNKVFKMVQLEKKYSQLIFQDLYLMLNIDKMFGTAELMEILVHDNLLYSPDCEGTSFGYDVANDKFVYTTKMKLHSYDIIEPLVKICTSSLSPVGMLDNLQVYSNDTPPESLANFVFYASYTAEFVNEYEQWSKKFHESFDAWILYHEVND